MDTKSDDVIEVAESRIDDYTPRRGLRDLINERVRQDKKWGPQNYGVGRWLCILQEELGEFARARLERMYANSREELVQVAAVALAMIECGDRNGWWVPDSAGAL